MEQEQLNSIRIGAELGKGMTLADVQKAPDRQILGLYLMMSNAVLTLVDEVERLQATHEDEPETVASGSRTFAPIGSTGHYGPIRVGATVQALVPVWYADILKGEVGTLTSFDTWDTEEYPYIAEFEGGRKAAFAREDIRRID